MSHLTNKLEIGKTKTKGDHLRKIAIALATSLLLIVGYSVPAVAKDKSLNIPKVASVSHPAKVKLVDSGCQKIPFKYTARGVDKDYGMLSVIFTDADGFTVGGAILVRGKFFRDKYPYLDELKNRGKFDVTVCREEWTDVRVNGQISDAWPGSVEVEFSATPKGVPDIDPRVMGLLKFTGKFK